MAHDPLDQVTTKLKSEVADVGDVSLLPPGRDEAIEKIEGALAHRAEVRRRRRVLSTLALAAGIVIAIGGAAALATRAPSSSTGSELARVREPASAVTVMRAGQIAPVAAGARIDEGAELRTPAGAEVHLDFDTGSAVSLGGATHVRLVEQSKKKRFALERGSLSARVAKLTPEERFVVTTTDAEIEVRGTAFRVTIVEPDPACGGGTPTRLDVSEGVVVVRHRGEQVSVAANERWPVCAPKTASGDPPAPPVVAVSGLPSAPAAVVSVASARPLASGSRLQEQNDLFDEAMTAKREGRTAVAIATFERLFTTFPRSPLAENATVERMRLLGTTDRARARVAAQDYLARYPEGFGRVEAEALAAPDR